MAACQFKYGIVGAGLSGLTTAHQLFHSGEKDFVVLDSRNHLGGRIHTKDHVDLGATWFQDHHTYLSQLVNEMLVEKYEQYSKGKSVLIYNTMAPAHFFESSQEGPNAFRIKNGTKSLITALSAPYEDKIQLSEKVCRILESNERIYVETEKNSYICQKVIVAMPPKLVKRIAFEPELPENLVHIMDQTHTWMSNAIKVGITYEKPFWREKGLSGTIIGQVGPVIELYDHSSHCNTHHSLMGFVNEGLRDTPPEERQERILGYLEKYFGEEARAYTNYFEKDWSKDPDTSGKELKSVYMSPKYGHPAFQEFYLNGKVWFSGAETSPVHGGYMDGAVYSGLQACKKLLEG